ncbi:MAG: nucleoside deaminase [Lachnospiraceae bacterium]|jgi:cytidine/deoxycytidylate deaminase family protein|nr:nucleoside deaminase [Lachnospiraceae bacterium]
MTPSNSFPSGQPQKKWMLQAIAQAKKAAAIGEVPIGCIIVYDGALPGEKNALAKNLGGKIAPGTVIGRGYNRRNADHSTFSHAEITAMKKASKKIGDWRLEACTMYVTLEPCSMCAGAIIQARLPRVVIGAMNPKAGCCGSVMNIVEERGFNHQAEVFRGFMEEDCSLLLTQFFKELRIRRKEERGRMSPPV